MRRRRPPNRHGPKQALRDLNRLGDVVFQSALRKARGAAARVVRDQAKTSTLFTSRTGNLVAGIKVQNTKKHTRLYANAPHSLVVERGHGGPRPAGPRPFLSSAARSTTDKQLSAAGKALAREVKRLHKP